MRGLPHVIQRPWALILSRQAFDFARCFARASVVGVVVLIVVKRRDLASVGVHGVIAFADEIPRVWMFQHDLTPKGARHEFPAFLGGKDVS